MSDDYATLKAVSSALNDLDADVEKVLGLLEMPNLEDA